ncbi:MAG: histidine phosphatase family protein [Bacteroidales bacterium]|nr:histidine phosphatase family protein [Bacteroidales bacterium]
MPLHAYIVRHGETTENRTKILQGHLPGQLTSQGMAQLEETATRLSHESTTFQRIVSSDLQRAVDSAQIIANHLHIAIDTTPLLRERDWGPFTGISIAEAAAKYRIDGQWQFPDNTTETETAIFERAQTTLRWLKQHYDNQDIVVVTHGQFARNLLAAHHHLTFADIEPFSNGEFRTITL